MNAWASCIAGIVSGLGKCLYPLAGFDIDSICHEAWLRVMMRIGMLRNPSAFRSWLFRICQRECQQAVRRRSRERTVAASMGLLDSVSCRMEEGVAESFDLSWLSCLDRAVLKMFYLDGRSVIQIAGRCGIPAGTAKTRIFRARDRARSIFRKGWQVDKR